MKYLKTYENIKLKKYIICDDVRVDGTSIYQILKNVDGELILKIINRYNNGIEAYYKKDMVYYGNNYKDLNIYYQTNNLDDAIDKLKLIDISKKYNL